MKGRRDQLLRAASLGRRRRRLPRFMGVLIALATVGGVITLWVWVFAPIFIEPKEWHARQKRFDSAIREVLRGARGGAAGAIPELPPWPDALVDDQVRLVACADAQVARGVRFSASYHAMTYPWGDVPEHLATSADLLVRCLRSGDLDLQQLLHIDRKARRRSYPLRLWANRRPDRSIDHRRLPNVVTFAEAYFQALPTETSKPEELATYQPGDVVFWSHGGTQGFPGLIGIVTDRRTPQGAPLVVTLVADERRATDHHTVTTWPIAGHFRIRFEEVLERFLEANPGAVLQPRPR